MFLFSVLIACYRRTGLRANPRPRAPSSTFHHLFTWARHHQNNHNHSHHPHMSGQPTIPDTLIVETSCPREYHREIRNRIHPTSAQCCVAANTALYYPTSPTSWQPASNASTPPPPSSPLRNSMNSVNSVCRANKSHRLPPIWISLMAPASA